MFKAKIVGYIYVTTSVTIILTESIQLPVVMVKIVV